MRRNWLSSAARFVFTSLFWLSVSFSFLGTILWWVPNDYYPPILLPRELMSPIFFGISSSLFSAWVVKTIFEPEMKLLNSLENSGLSGVWVTRGEFDDTQWCETIRNTKRRCLIFGMASGNYRRDDKTENVIRECLSKRNTTLDIYFLDPTWTDMIQFRAQEENRALTDEIKRTIVFFHSIRSQLVLEQQNRFKIKVYRATPTVSITQSDNYMIVTHYLAGYPNSEAPIYILTDSGQRFGKETLFHYHEKNIEKIKDRPTTKEINNGNIHEYGL